MELKPFAVKDELRQGRVLGPTLFLVVIDDIMKKIEKKIRTMNVGYRNLKQVEANDMRRKRKGPANKHARSK